MSEILNPIADARRAAIDHRFDEAASSALGRAGVGSPTCLAALRILAWAQLELDDDAALTTFERCAALDPEDALAYVGQAIWYQQRRQDDGAPSANGSAPGSSTRRTRPSGARWSS